jgi:hypothetical protein
MTDLPSLSLHVDLWPRLIRKGVDPIDRRLSAPSLAIFASSTLFGWSRREPQRSEEIIIGPELDRSGITLI